MTKPEEEMEVDVITLEKFLEMLDKEFEKKSCSEKPNNSIKAKDALSTASDTHTALDR